MISTATSRNLKVSASFDLGREIFILGETKLRGEKNETEYLNLNIFFHKGDCFLQSVVNLGFS